MNTATHLPMRALALALGSSLAPPLTAQEYGPSQELTANTGEIQDTTTGDFNGDGILDVVYSNSKEIRLFLGGPAGQFQPATAIHEVVNMTTIGLVDRTDLDGDGDLDLLFQTSNPAFIHWANNLGDGSFAVAQLVPGVLIDCPVLKTADLDGDGDLDFYSSTTVLDRVFWSANLGGNQFGPQQTLPDSDHIPTWVDAGDFDGDGDLDLVATFIGNPTLALWENLGSGGFGPRQDIANGLSVQSFVQCADVNNDGNLDLLTLRYSFDIGVISWHLGDGAGSFGPPTTIFHSPGITLPAALADIDDDGRIDLVLGSMNLSPLTWLQNQSMAGSVAYGPPTTFAEQTTGLAAFSIADVDGNGTEHAILASSSMNKLAWYGNEGFGLFGLENEISASASNAMEALMVDFDGDGNRDVASLSTNDRKLALYTSLGGSAFDQQRLLATLPPNQVCMDTGDLDGDGDADFVVGGASPDVLAWYPNLGNGEVGSPIPIATGVLDASAVHVTDLDADGLLDLLVTSEQSDSVLWIPNVSGPGFGAAQIVSGTALEATSVSGADMDGDGDLDVLYTSKGSFSTEDVVWRENLGGGTFGSTIQVATLTNARDAVATDVNRDGRLDVVACGSQTLWYQGMGTNTYFPGDGISTGFTRCIDANDVDGDGDPDVLVAKNSTLTWHRRTGFGGWSLPKIIEEDLEDPRSVRWTDVDGDGDPDVLYAGGEESTVQWYENLMDPSIGVPDCDPAETNSTGLPGSLSGIGSPWVPNNALVLTADSLPQNQVGLFLTSPDAGLVVGAGGSQGTLCLSGPIGRFREPGQVQSSGPEGSLSLSIDLTQIPNPLGFASVLMGEQWHFQVWYRDQNPGPTSNFTNGLVVAFQ